MDPNDVLSLDEIKCIYTWRGAMDVIGLKEDCDVARSEVGFAAVEKRRGINEA